MAWAVVRRAWFVWAEVARDLMTRLMMMEVNLAFFVWIFLRSR